MARGLILYGTYKICTAQQLRTILTRFVHMAAAISYSKKNWKRHTCVNKRKRTRWDTVRKRDALLSYGISMMISYCSDWCTTYKIKK